MASTQPAIRADVDPRHFLRFLLIGGVAIGFGLWTLYDGAIGFPNQRERALEFQRLDEEGRSDEWRDFAEERGWPTSPPGEPKTDADFLTQYIMAAGAGTVGLIFLVTWFRSRGRWIEADATGLRSSWGQSLEFEQVVLLDKKRWRNKGIAKVTYEDGNRKRRFVLDDYKFLRQPTDLILYELESKIDIEKIVGGPPEPAPDQAAAESADAAEDETANTE